MAAVFTFDPGKAVEEIAAIQKPFHNLFDMGAKEPVYSFKTIFIDLLQGFKVVFDALVVMGLFWISGSVRNSWLRVRTNA
jgi:hypothetical protein